jgi:hypothetical protein
MNLDDKIDFICSTLSYAESALGLEEGILKYNIQDDPLFKQKGTNAVFIANIKTIFIEKSWISSWAVTPYSIIDCILHEARHAWQYLLCTDKNYHSNDIDPMVIKLWEQELLSDYTDQASDFDKYYNQSSEIDARNWADEHFEKITGLKPSTVFKDR